MQRYSASDILYTRLSSSIRVDATIKYQVEEDIDPVDSLGMARGAIAPDWPRRLGFKPVGLTLTY